MLPRCRAGVLRRSGDGGGDGSAQRDGAAYRDGVLTHDRPVGRRSRPPRPVQRTRLLPPRRRRGDRAASALGLAAGTTAGVAILLTWLDSRGTVDLGISTRMLALSWLGSAVLGVLALLAPVITRSGPPIRRRGHPSLLRRRRRTVIDLTLPAPAARRPLPPWRALALVAAATAALLLVIALVG